MNTSEVGKWDESTSAPNRFMEQTGPVFESLFERSADAIWLFDPEAGVFLDCNQAALELIGASNKEQLLRARPEDLSPAFQADGTPTSEKSAQIIALVEKHKTHRFEWLARRMDGREIPLEVSSTAIFMGGRNINVVMSRDITERKRAEADLRESEEKFRQLFEASTDAIAIFDPQTRTNIACNQATVKLMGDENKEWFLRHPVESLSPGRQPDGKLSKEAGKVWVERALSHGPQRFEWVARRNSGEEFPLEILLTPLRLGGRLLLVSVARDITERKRAEQALLEVNQSLERRVAERTAALTTSEAQFRALVEHAPEAIVVFNGDNGRFLFGNEHACRLYGVPMDGLAELTPADVSPEFQPNGRRSSELAREKMDEALSGGTLVFEWIHRQPDGRLIPTEVRLLRLPTECDNLIRASIIDNTERTRAEESLKQRVGMSTLNAEVALALNAGAELQAMLRRCCELVVQYLDAAFVRVWTLNETTQTLELQASAGCYTHLDGPHSRVKVGQYKIGLIARERKPHLTNSIQSDPRVSDKQWAAREGIVAFAGYPLLLEDRVLGVLALFARRPLAEEVLKTIGSVADSIALGIERKRAQTALSESEARFSAAFEACPIFISMMRMSDEKYVLANEALLNWLGCTREETLGRSSAELGIWEDFAEREAVWRALRTVGSIRQKECRWRNRRGQVFTFLLSAESIKVNNVPHVLSMALDITQRKRAEEELLRTLEREKELSQLKSNFVSMVSHEFRTPLGIIQSSAELLRDFFPRMQPAEREEQLESITRNTCRMAGMMEEILVLSRLDAGKLDFQPSALDLPIFCRRVVDEVLSATNRLSPIEVSLASDLPQAHADERLLGHILINLLSNAVKYSEPGGAVRFAIEREGSAALFVIKDEGIGISQKDQQRLFTAFHRGANVGNRAGTGLGLVLVRRCVELHQGRVRIESKVGHGTTVSVRVPVFSK